jgi:hypothetical protein
LQVTLQLVPPQSTPLPQVVAPSQSTVVVPLAWLTNAVPHV